MVSLVQHYLQQSAKRYPNAVAVEDEARRSTFSKLDAETNRLARFLKCAGVKRGDRVAFCLPKSLEAIESLWAILKADAIYVPLDAHAPLERLARVVRDAEPAVIICNDAVEPLVASLKRDTNFPFCVVSLVRAAPEIARCSDGVISYENVESDIAYILYTSGSTGIPKGVMITHGNIIHATEWAVGELGITHADRLSQHPPLHFDLSTFDIYTAMKSGAALVLVPDKLVLFPGELLRWIEEGKRLTIWDSVPSVMVYLSRFGLVRPGRMPSVKKVFFNGEVFPPRFLREWMRAFPEKEFVNLYGPTEATVQSTFYRVPEAPEGNVPVPIGAPCRNSIVIAVNGEGREAASGEIGELWIGGPGVSPGYWRNKEKTQEVFAERAPYGRMYKTGDLAEVLPDGQFRFVGRKDNQVKVMGHRIELGDVEAALYGLPYVHEAAVLALPDEKMKGAKLIAFVVTKETKERVILDLLKKLPAYMIPQIDCSDGQLFKTSTGKIDRQMLRRFYEGSMELEQRYGSSGEN